MIVERRKELKTKDDTSRRIQNDSSRLSQCHAEFHFQGFVPREEERRIGHSPVSQEDRKVVTISWLEWSTWSEARGKYVRSLGTTLHQPPCRLVHCVIHPTRAIRKEITEARSHIILVSPSMAPCTTRKRVMYVQRDEHNKKS